MCPDNDRDKNEGDLELIIANLHIGTFAHWQIKLLVF